MIQWANIDKTPRTVPYTYLARAARVFTIINNIFGGKFDFLKLFSKAVWNGLSDIQSILMKGEGMDGFEPQDPPPAQHGHPGWIFSVGCFWHLSPHENSALPHRSWARGEEMLERSLFLVNHLSRSLTPPWSFLSFLFPFRWCRDRFTEAVGDVPVLVTLWVLFVEGAGTLERERDPRSSFVCDIYCLCGSG